MTTQAVPPIKILFLTGELKHYRIPILDIIGRGPDIDLTVAHAGKPMRKKENHFQEVILEEVSIGPFTYHNKNLSHYCRGFDVVVAMLYLQKISFMRLLLTRKRRFKLIFWGIGVKASQKSTYDQPTVLNQVRYAIARMSDAMIFYSDRAREKYKGQGICGDKLFVMQNTVAVSQSVSEKLDRNSILFVGTLNPSKKIFLLLNSYMRALRNVDKMPPLEIVGKGVEFESVKEWVRENVLEKNIQVHGAIYDDNLLEVMFKRSLACISPGQAGLSVLTSFGYGTPFVTSNDAITGGERFNIINHHNGLLFDTEDELVRILEDIAHNPAKFETMGANAHKYYREFRTPEIMAGGFIDAVKFVTRTKK